MGLTAFNLARRRVLQAHLAVVVPELPTASGVSAPEPSDAAAVVPTAVDESSPPPTDANPTLVLRVYPALTLDFIGNKAAKMASKPYAAGISSIFKVIAETLAYQAFHYFR